MHKKTYTLVSIGAAFAVELIARQVGVVTAVDEVVRHGIRQVVGFGWRGCSFCIREFGGRHVRQKGVKIGEIFFLGWIIPAAHASAAAVTVGKT